MFIRSKGKTKFQFLPVTVSTALSEGALLTQTAGFLVAAVAGTAQADLAGILRHNIVSTDADFATARLVEVEVPVEKHVVWEFDTAGLIAADIGLEVDLTDSLTVNRGGHKLFALCVQPKFFRR